MPHRKLDVNNCDDNNMKGSDGDKSCFSKTDKSKISNKIQRNRLRDGWMYTIISSVDDNRDQTRVISPDKMPPVSNLHPPCKHTHTHKHQGGLRIPDLIQISQSMMNT